MASSRRSWIGVVLLVVGVAVGVALWWRGEQRAHEPPTAQRGEPVERATASALAEADRAEPLAWMTEPGVAPRRIAGVVLQDGAPVADAVVRLGSLRTSLARLDEPEVRTGADGAFDFGLQAVDRYRVLAQAEPDRYARAVVELRDPMAEAAADALVLELDACAAWTWGRVVDAGGGPVIGARVERGTLVPGGIVFADVTVLTDEDGGFRICGRGGYELTVSADGYGTVRIPEGASPRVIMLVPAAQLAGVVVDEEERPIVEAMLTLFSADSKARVPVGQPTVSDSAGRFRFDRLDPGRYSLFADAAEHFAIGTEHAEYLLDVGEARDDVVVVMRRCTRVVAGHVLGLDEPIAGARISMGSGIFGDHVQDDGSFVVRCDDGTGFDIQVAGYDVVDGGRVPDGGEDLLDHVVRVERRAEIRGRVTFDGAPVAGAVVAKDPEAPPMAGLLGWELRARTDEQGNFVVTGAPPGKHVLQALDPKTGRRSEPHALDVRERETVDGIELGLHTVAELAGVVRDERGAPLAFVDVSVQPKAPRSRPMSAQADSDGHFRVIDLPRGMYVVSVAGRFEPAAATGWPTVEIANDGASHTADVVARAAKWGAIAGRVTYTDGAPAAYAYIRLTAGDGAAIADLTGRFALRDVPPGEHALRVVATDGAQWDGTARAGDRELAIVLQRPGRIIGTVGGAALGSYVKARHEQQHTTRSAEVRDGQFVLAGLSPGGYTVELFAPSSGGRSLMGPGSPAAARAEVAVIEGQASSVQLVVDGDRGGAGTIAGRALVYPSGDPAPGLECSAAGRTAATDDAGRFELAQVSSGTLVVGCHNAIVEVAGPMTLGEQRTTVADGARVEVVVHVVRVKNVGHSGEMGARLTLVPGAQPAAVAFTAIRADGAAAAGGLGEGDVLLAVEGAPATGEHVSAARTYLELQPAGRRIDLQVRKAGGDEIVDAVLVPR